LEIGGLSLDQKSYRTSVNGNAVALVPTDSAVTAVLISR